MFFVKSTTNNKIKSVKFPKYKNVKRKYSFTKSYKHENVGSDEYEDSTYEDFNDKAMLKKDQRESPQEKKLRLAKIYLKEIENNLECTVFGAFLKSDLVEKQLKEDYLKKTGKYLAVATNSNVNVDVDNIKILTCKEHKKSLTCICISSDNTFAFSGSKDGIIVKWSLTEMKKLGKISNKDIRSHAESIFTLTITNDNKFLAVGDKSNDIKIWNPNKLKYINKLTGHRDSVTALAFRKNNHTLYSASKDKSVKVWCLDNMCYVETLFGHTEIISSIDCLYKENVISGSDDKTVRLWKIPEETQFIFKGHTGNVNCVTFINEDYFVSGGDDGKLCVWRRNKKNPSMYVNEAHGCNPINNQPFWINTVTCLINTEMVASGSEDGFIRFWSLEGSFERITILFTIPINGVVNDLSFLNDGKYLIASVGSEHKFGRWNVVRSAKNSLVMIPVIIN